MAVAILENDPKRQNGFALLQVDLTGEAGINQKFLLDPEIREYLLSIREVQSGNYLQKTKGLNSWRRSEYFFKVKMERLTDQELVLSIPPEITERLVENLFYFTVKAEGISFPDLMVQAGDISTASKTIYMAPINLDDEDEEDDETGPVDTDLKIDTPPMEPTNLQEETKISLDHEKGAEPPSSPEHSESMSEAQIAPTVLENKPEPAEPQKPSIVPISVATGPPPIEVAAIPPPIAVAPPPIEVAATPPLIEVVPPYVPPKNENIYEPVLYPSSYVPASDDKRKRNLWWLLLLIPLVLFPLLAYGFGFWPFGDKESLTSSAQVEIPRDYYLEGCWDSATASGLVGGFDYGPWYQVTYRYCFSSPSAATVTITNQDEKGRVVDICKVNASHTMTGNQLVLVEDEEGPVCQNDPGVSYYSSSLTCNFLLDGSTSCRINTDGSDEILEADFNKVS
ncbi:MAG: hypothetical protein LBE38_00940 [Deltaproteobacteria bacterium]|jgi:hypothetical protein|nr:hypothetical protein [Deltaproteobacteria bacterium]